MNIASPQRDLGVSVSNETHFSSQRDKTLKCECHLQSKGGTRNRAICRYSFVRYERYSLTATITYRYAICFLCEENRPTEQMSIPFIKKYAILCNPFPILKNHLTIALHSHVPQRIRHKIADMLTLAEQLDDYIVFYNGPKCGASAPDHFHFQAGLKSEVLMQGDNDLRSCLSISSEDKDEALELFEEVYQYLSSLQPKEEEPMLNVISYYENGFYNINIFPRKLHRPTQYYSEGNNKILISPGALDMAGLLITVREEDFIKIGKSEIEDIYNQVSLLII